MNRKQFILLAALALAGQKTNLVNKIGDWWELQKLKWKLARIRWENREAVAMAGYTSHEHVFKSCE